MRNKKRNIYNFAIGNSDKVMYNHEEEVMRIRNMQQEN